MPFSGLPPKSLPTIMEMFSVILAKIKQHDILSPEFRSIIEPCTGGNIFSYPEGQCTDNFLHKIYCFAVLHNTLDAYDSATLYVRMEETQVQTTRHLLQPIPNNPILAPPPPMSPPDIVVLDHDGLLEADDPEADHFNNSQTVDSVPSASGA
jgi:hypothetical protein